MSNEAAKRDRDKYHELIEMHANKGQTTKDGTFTIWNNAEEGIQHFKDSAGEEIYYGDNGLEPDVRDQLCEKMWDEND